MAELDLAAFREWLVNKDYSENYIKKAMPYVKKYIHIIFSNNFGELNTLSKYVLNHALKALTLISKYLGIYTEFRAKLDQHGIKWYRPNALSAFLRILNANTKDTMEWYN